MFLARSNEPSRVFFLIFLNFMAEADIESETLLIWIMHQTMDNIYGNVPLTNQILSKVLEKLKK
jgi:hypothetical protein